jgi:heme ABC exporter ATP-binding subunit CcmA
MAHAVHLRSAVALAGRFPALSGVDLSVDPGEVVALVGPNGAGKTSILRVCAGLLPVASGEAVVLGHDLRQDPAAVRRLVGYLGHAAPLYEELTTWENVRFAVRAAGEGTDRVQAAMERLGLVGRLKKTTVGRLSAGQRRRVALAILLARRSVLWLLDEPHASLDAGGRRLVDQLIAEAAAAGAAVLVASHEPDVVATVAHRVAVLAGGLVLRDEAAGLTLADPLSTVEPAGSHVA